MRLLTGWLHFAPQLLLAVVIHVHQVDSILGVIIDDTGDRDDHNEFALCGDCFCIMTGDVPCPKRPDNSFGTAGDIELLKVQAVLNPYELNCNPYEEASCQVVLSQNGTLVAMGEQAVFGVRYEASPHFISIDHLSQGPGDQNSDKNENKYTTGSSSSAQIVRKLQCPKHHHLTTYESFDAAKSDGAVVTHAGAISVIIWHLIPLVHSDPKACGACSTTTKDLSAYLAHVDLTNLGSLCVAEGLVSFEKGVECFTNHGLTKTCAIAWMDVGYKTRDACLGVCVRSRLMNDPNNGPLPICELNECLQCDEDKDGPLFKQFAARTRRRSGLLSKIARPCNQIVYGIDHNPC